jgi:3-oxoacyl-[acyl-carrier-protein] synthase II
VVVTGAGTVNPLGRSVEESWKNIVNGVSGVGPITLFDAALCPVRFAAEVKAFDPTAPLAVPVRALSDREPLVQPMSAKDARRCGRYAQLGVHAGPQAYLDSGLDESRAFYAPERMGVNIGVGMGGLGEIEAVHDAYREKGFRGITPYFILQAIPNIPSGQLSILLNLKDPNHCNAAACATVLVLEEPAAARKWGATIYGEITGYGATSDAYHLTTPAPEGEGAGRAMQEALRDAGLRPADIDYVNAHATSTPAGDVEEAAAIARVLGGRRDTVVAVSSTKSMTGHMFGAAGATEALFSLLALRDQVVPPTANLHHIDEACGSLGLSFPAHRAECASLRHALSNSFGFGGTNASLIFSKI